MSDGMTVQLIGWDRFVSQLNGPVAERFADPKQANEEAAKIVAILVRDRAPSKTGRLRGSISTRAGTSKGGEASAEVYSELVYAPVINWGWPRHDIRATHFFDGAFHASEDEVKAAYEKYLQSVMDEVRA